VLHTQHLRKNTLPQYAGASLSCAEAIVAVKTKNTQVACTVVAAE
jgi:hypothetical protein